MEDDQENIWEDEDSEDSEDNKDDGKIPKPK